MDARNQHDLHIRRAEPDLRTIFRFNSPSTGREVHDVNESYPAAEEFTPAT